MKYILMLNQVYNGHFLIVCYNAYQTQDSVLFVHILSLPFKIILNIWRVVTVGQGKSPVYEKNLKTEAQD